MSPLRFLLLAVGCGLGWVEPLAAQLANAPFVPDKQYSADMVYTSREGTTYASKVNMDMDLGKIRSEMNEQGMQMLNIVRLDQKKIYTVMPDQKMVMVMPLDAEKMKMLPPTSAADGKFEWVGPDIVDGVPCTKYKMTAAKDNKVFFWWVNVATKTPVKMTAEDGSFAVLWKNYQAGPQDPALFEPPAGYQVMAMPNLPGMPGGGGQ